MESVFLKHYKKNNLPVPEFHFVLGSGFSSSLDKLLSEKDFKEWSEGAPLFFKDVPGLKVPTAPTHLGVYRYFTHKPTGKCLCFQSGRLHGYEGHSAREVAQTVLWPRLAGTKKFILTNISGSLRENIPPGEIVALSDHINFTGQNPLTGENPKDSQGKNIGPRFPDMESTYNPQLTDEVIQQLKTQQGLAVHKGIYIGVSGPSLETPAEVALFAKWGLTVVGMSTVFEAIALKHAGAKVSAFSLVSNFACGLQKNISISEEDMAKTVNRQAPKVLKGFFEFSHRYFTEEKVS